MDKDPITIDKNDELVKCALTDGSKEIRWGRTAEGISYPLCRHDPGRDYLPGADGNIAFPL